MVKDFNGSFTKVGLSLALFESNNGLDWKPAKYPLICKPQIQWENGTKNVKRLERPQILFEKGIPKVLYCAVYDVDGDNYNVAIPLNVK